MLLDDRLWPEHQARQPSELYMMFRGEVLPKS